MGTISILGCGWLGFPLAKNLVSCGFEVKGSTRSHSKNEQFLKEGIAHFVIDLAQEKMGNTSFFDSDILIISIPPGSKKNGHEEHPNQIQRLIDSNLLTKTNRVIYISSTSVYPEGNIVYQETFELTDSKHGNAALYYAEKYLQEALGDKLTIIRLAGLFGYDRNPAKYFSGRTDIKKGNHGVNVIHRDDVIGILSSAIQAELVRNTYAICTPEHPKKKEYYTAICKRFHMPEPQFAKDTSEGKIIDGSRIIKELGYQYRYPSPYDFYFDEIRK